MAVSAPGTDPESVDALIVSGDLEGARAALAEVPDQDERYALVRIKLGLYDESLPAAAAMHRLVQLMRSEKQIPGARELYQEAARRADQAGESNVAHSHPPPQGRPSKR